MHGLTVFFYQRWSLRYFVITDRAFFEIMKYHALPGFFFITMGIAAMKQVGMPYDQVVF